MFLCAPKIFHQKTEPFSVVLLSQQGDHETMEILVLMLEHLHFGD